MRWVWLVLLAGCYDPHAAPGIACSANDLCPEGLDCIAGTCEVPGDTLDATLVALWKLDDDPADGVLDDSGRGHTATCESTCPMVVAGKLGNGYRFDGQMALVVPDDSDFRGVFTIAAWVWADMKADDISAMAKPVGPDSDNSWQLETHGDRVSLSGGGVHYLDSPSAMSRETWHHLAGTWDGTTKRLFVDGTAVAEVASTVSYDSHDIVLGADQNSGSTVLHWSGVLDEIRVYSRVLSDAELAALAR